jgi:hypothetical protein
MNAQNTISSLGEKEVIQSNWIQRLGLFILFLIFELAIVLFGSNYFDVFQTNKNLAYQEPFLSRSSSPRYGSSAPND